METQAGTGGEIWRDDITEPNYGLAITAVSTAFFWLVSKIAMFIVPTVASSTAKSSWKWKNTCTSFMHSILTAAGAVYCMFERPDMAEDLITVYTPTSHALVSFSVGYFVYDMFDMIVCERSRQSYELIGHHMVVMTCFGSAVWFRHYIGYAVVALLVELNSIFLHLRMLLQVCGITKYNAFYRLNSLVNLATFIVFRILLLAWMTRWLVLNRERVPFVFYTLGSVGLAIIIAMNIVLFYRLLRSDFISKSSDKESSCKKGE